MSLKQGYTVVYENVQQGKTWVLSENGSRVIGQRLEPYLVPELNSKQTVHLFDAKAGINSYEIKLVVGGAKQVVFSSANRNSYAQFCRGPVFVACLPSTSEKEFYRFASILGASSDTIKRVIELSGTGKIRPLTSLLNHSERITTALKVFDLKNISAYTSPDYFVSGEKNPAILLDAFVPDDLDADEEDLNVIYNNYTFSNISFKFCNDNIVEQLFNKFGTEADIIVESMYYALGSDYNRSFGPAIGRLFEKCAVKPDFISRHGLSCRLIEEEESDVPSAKEQPFTLGKDFKVEDVVSNQIIPLDKVIRECTDQKVIYNFGKNHEGFDCFIPPNNFIGFTVVKSKNHPISLSFALKSCELINGPVNFITAVPANHKEGWKKQSFKINVSGVFEDNRGQSTFNKLPTKEKSKLLPFRQFVGSLVTKRNMSVSAFPTNAASALLRPTILIVNKLFK